MMYNVKMTLLQFQKKHRFEGIRTIRHNVKQFDQLKNRRRVAAKAYAIVKTERTVDCAWPTITFRLPGGSNQHRLAWKKWDPKKPFVKFDPKRCNIQWDAMGCNGMQWDAMGCNGHIREFLEVCCGM